VTSIALRGVGFTYPDGTVALRDVELQIPTGQAVAIVGQNGSGKSTLVRHLNGLLRPTAGAVEHAEVDIAGRRVADLAATVGVVFQNPDRQIFAGKVRAEVAFGPRILGRPDADVRIAVGSALEAVGLTGLETTNPYDLGYSRRKLLSLAAILAMETPVLVLDEPTTGQDARGVARIQTVIRDVVGAGRTVIAVSHDMRFVAETFERIVVMRAGTVVADGSPADVFAAASWPTLRSTYLDPPLAALIGDRLGLGSTPTEAALIDAVAARG
jgi:energy-coupling factor transport system ATP-binding protein